MKIPKPKVPVGEDVSNLIDNRELTAEEQRNLAHIERWKNLYNGNDMAAFVNEAYHPEVKATIYDGTDFDGSKIDLDSPKIFIETEKRIKKSCPGRKIVIERYIPAGNVVVLEALIVDDARPDFRLAWCGILTFKDGVIISDHSYLNHKHWPGLVDALNEQ
jgi:hypothetical protein